MRSEEEIRKELELTRECRKHAFDTKYPNGETALGFIQLLAEEKILEWVLNEGEE